MEKLNQSRPNQFAFIPHKLIIEGRPELEVFSYNILFMSLANIDGVDTSGTALYLPDLGTFRSNGQVSYMCYFNQFQKSPDFVRREVPPEDYSSTDYIDLWFFEEDGRYEASKYISGVLAYESSGKTWKDFFIHLTMPGLAQNEACEFRPFAPED